MKSTTRHIIPGARSPQAGFALITTLLMLTVLSSLLAAYLIITRIEIATGKSSSDSMSGFFAAEAGLNLRAEEIRSIFLGYNTPNGTSPSTANPCAGGNNGTGDFACESIEINGREVRSYVIDHQPGIDPPLMRITSGLYKNLYAQEYTYTANSETIGLDDQIEAILQLRFKSRVVPMFQFVAFYNKDLEILPGPTMNLNGPIHVNGDLYVQSENLLNIYGQISASGTVYRGRKNDSSCIGNSVQVMDPGNLRQFIGSCPHRTAATNAHMAPFNGQIVSGVDTVHVPPPDVIDPTPGKLYWDRADLRLVLNVTGSANSAPNTAVVSTGIEVRNADDSVNAAATNILHNCGANYNISRSIRRNPAANDNAMAIVGTSYSFRNNREDEVIRMLDIDMRALFDCLHRSNWLGMGGRTLADNTEGGLVFFFTVKGPQSTHPDSPYGVRVRNGDELQSRISGAPQVRGLTIVSDQAFYLQGDYNSVRKIPASALVDSFNVLSNAFYDTGASNFRDNWTTQNVNNRNATSTVQNLAIMAGTDTTGNAEGPGGQGGAYNGGLENYPRFHENWTGDTYTYRGSFVSLNRPRRVNGAWVYGAPQYTAPNRNWDYDTSFSNAANLPPLSPRFVYLKQELFVRDFER